MPTVGPVQLLRRLDAPRWKLDRALELGLIPLAGPEGRWDEATAAAIAHAWPGTAADVGEIQDLGAIRMADQIRERYPDLAITADVVPELEHLGHTRTKTLLNGYPVYDGLAVEAFLGLDDARAILEGAIITGRLLVADAAANHLRIRRSAFDHLVRQRWIRRRFLVVSSHRPKYGAPNTPLYRAGDLDVLALDERIPWEAERERTARSPSPFRALGPRPAQ